MKSIRGWLESTNPVLFSLYAGLAGFCAYFLMYAFRKPFSAATFEAVDGWSFEIDYKVVLVIAQVAGYALSKVIGIRVIAETGRNGRAMAILGLIGLSWLALVLFAVLPTPWNIAALFLNGLPLGLIWGLVFSFMEGRRTSEVLGAILCASFILSSGVVKSAGKMLLNAGVDEFWMPAAAGVIFMPLLLVSVWGLTQLPPPNAGDEAERVRRAPMKRGDRRAFLNAYGPGVLLLVLAYVLFTAFRDFRDNFSAEIWAAIGYGDAASVFTASELPVAIFSLAALGSIMLVRDNVRALLVMHGIVVAGAALIGLSTLAFQMGMLSPVVWMILNGTGLYLAYTPFNAMLFDRLIAATRQVGTAGFLIYVADASGYVGSVALLLVKSFGAPQLAWLDFFITSAYASAIISLALTAASGVYFARRLAADKTVEPGGLAAGGT
jgi:hypothetical protein